MELSLWVVIVFAVAFLASCGLLVWVLAALKSESEQREALGRQLAQREQAIESYAATIEQRNAELRAAGTESAELRAELATLKEREQNFEKRVAELRKEHEQAEARAREAFKALAGDVLKDANASFLQLARKALQGEQQEATAELEQRKQAIDAMLKPIRESLDRQAKALTDVEKSREGAYRELRQQVASLHDTQKQLAAETGNLAKAMRRPEVRGKWGEMQLKRVAELAGMIDHCDFTEQVSVRDGEGKTLRPDMVVQLPAGRQIIVDAKVAFDAYLDAIESDDDARKHAELDRLVRHVETHIRGLAGKAYTSQFDRTPDFVVMFVPLESLLQTVLVRKPDLLESAMNLGVVIATPSTLIALLKAVAMGWREEQLTQNAARIQQLGEELHERLAIMTDRLTKLGGTLKTTVNHYNSLVGSYEGRVLVTARRFKELGADSAKELPAEGALEEIDEAPRKLSSVEAVEGEG